MKWFFGNEVCDILGRFDHLHLIGDDMLRHAAQALHVLIRRDLVNGGKALWSPDPALRHCDCHGVFDDIGCVFSGAINTQNILDNDPKSIPCHRKPALVTCEIIFLQYFFIADAERVARPQLSIDKRSNDFNTKPAQRESG